MSPKTRVKLTATVVAARLRRVDGKLVPSVAHDSDVSGFSLIVTSRRAFWAVAYQPRGINPSTGKRWGGGVRHEIGDAYSLAPTDARAIALKVKARVRMGEDPHRERMALRADAEIRRTLLPSSVGDALSIYARVITARPHLSESTKRKNLHYTRKALRLLGGQGAPLAAIGAHSIRLMTETMDGSVFERRHVFSALNRFLSWCAKERVIERNPCNDIDNDDRPKPGRSRDNTPSIKTLRCVWAAVDQEPGHKRDLIRFLLLVPLRREEAQGLLWSEVDLDEKRILIGAHRMKNRQPHTLPLAEPALTILTERAAYRSDSADSRVFASPSAARTINWDHRMTRIRAAIGQGDLDRPRRFNLHDVRRGFVSHLAEQGFDVDLLDQCLSHTRKGVLGVYQRSSRWPERVRALNAWTALICGEAQSDADNVVRFTTR